ncbi:MAG: hypothetical protein K0Q81_1921, partial [Paenibacillus sp.]|nr:hypothetical protein [Paenibacillus sp.]
RSITSGASKASTARSALKGYYRGPTGPNGRDDGMNEIKRYEKLLVAADKASKKAAEVRANLGIGASRARVTSANARWARAAEERDRISDKLDQLKQGVMS